MDISFRKKELVNKLDQITKEAATTMSLVNALVHASKELIKNINNNVDGSDFIMRYPSVVCDLNAHFYKLLEFNCGMYGFATVEISTPSPCAEEEDCKPIIDKVSKGHGNIDVAAVDVTPVATCHKTGNSRNPRPCPTKGVNHCAQDFALPILRTTNFKKLADTLANTKNSSDEELLPVANKYGNCKRLFQTSSSESYDTTRFSSLKKDKLSIQEYNRSGKHHQKYCPVARTPIPSSTASLKPASGTKKLISPKPTTTPKLKCTKILNSAKRPTKMGDKCEVMLSHIISPGEFYVHIVCHENFSFDQFYKDLNEFYSKKKVTFKDINHAKSLIGNFCCCYQPEIEWCRGQILNWCSVDDYIEVQLIDYGDVCYVTLEMVQPLAQVFYQSPLFATRCHLAFLIPPEQNDLWPLESAKVFKYYMPPTNKWKTKQLEGTIDVTPKVYTIIKAEDKEMFEDCSKAHQHESSISVILLDLEEKEKLPLNDILVDLGYATLSAVHEPPTSQCKNEYQPVPNVKFRESLKNQDFSQMSAPLETSNAVADHQKLVLSEIDYKSSDQRSSVLKTKDSEELGNLLDSWNPMQDDFLDPSVSCENALLAVSGYDPKDESRVCKFYARNGRCYKGLNCRKEHSFLYKDGITTDKELIYTTTFSSFCMPVQGTVVGLRVTHVPKDQKYFYCVLEPILIDLEEETITSLTKHMNDPKQVKTYKHLLVPPAPGQLVLAYSAVKNLWKRARVVEEPNDEENTLKVFFVDTGRTEIIADRCVRAMEPFLLHLPLQAMECYLANVEVVQDPRVFASHFKALYLFKVLRAKVILSLEEHQVVHCLLLDEYGVDVGASLVKTGLCVPKDNFLRQLIMVPG